MSTNPITPTGPGSDPDENPDLVDPGLDDPGVSTPPGENDPLSVPVPEEPPL
ncbi:hypothetical protein [Kribbella sp. DT2]|uniref:hypothetical protein n=1 Tax=Kribbella sp. DT2 TaxID=3393427 RepID=UPI003CFAD61D